MHGILSVSALQTTVPKREKGKREKEREEEKKSIP